MRVPIAKFVTMMVSQSSSKTPKLLGIANISGGATQYRGATAINRGFTGADYKSSPSLLVFNYAENTYMIH